MRMPCFFSVKWVLGGYWWGVFKIGCGFLWGFGGCGVCVGGEGGVVVVVVVLPGGLV